MTRINSTGLALAAVVAAVATARGAGYALYEGSARGNVDAAGLAAGGGEPGALYFNPATITDLDGTQIQLGFSAIYPRGDVETTNPYTGEKLRTETDENLWNIPSIFVTHAINDSLVFGFGAFARYGLGAEIDPDWPGRYNSYKAIIQAVDLNPNLAWKVNDKLSVSAGVTIRHFDIELAQKIDAAGLVGARRRNDPAPSPYDIDQNLHGDDVGFGFDLGIQYRPVESLALGAAYHSRIKFEVEGDAKWDKPAAVNAFAPAFFNDTGFSSVNWNPDLIMLAAAWDATERLTLAAGLTCTMWSVYDDLVIEFDTPALAGRDRVESVKGWHDAWRAAFSASYALTDAFTARAGYVYDNSPLNGAHVDYLVPADNRHILGLGLGWDEGKAWAIDVSYFYEIVEDYTVSGRPAAGVFDGAFSSGTAHALAISATRCF